MQRSFSQSCLWAICLSILCAPILFAQTKQPPAQRWEYKAISCDPNELSKLGDEGWELVAVTTQSGGYCGSYLLRRPKAANAPKYVDPNERPKPTVNSPTCNLSAAQAPIIRGLRLGMNVDELLELFPGANPVEFKRRVEDAKLPSSFGALGYSFSGIQHKDRLEGFMFSMRLFDGRVRSFEIKYSFNNRASYGDIYEKEDFVNKLSESLGLPTKESWIIASYNHASLNCQGFKLETDFQAFITISVENISQPYEEILKERYKESLFGKRSEFKP